ncbi:MAG: hypothetical protein IJY12_01115 [Clostridia bacterium]|nr:hypothetical protein [Clostridia bacterium]
MLYVFLALVLAVVLLLFLSVHIHVLYEGGAPTVFLRVLCFKKILYPAPPNLDKPKKDKKKEKKKKKKVKVTEVEPPKKKSLSDIRDSVHLILTILNSIKDKFFSTLRVTAAKIYISVDSDNATKTALLYGGICQGVSYLLEFLDNITQLKTVKNTHIHVGCDFSVQETTAEVHLILSMRIYQLLGHAFRAVKAFITVKLHNEFKNTKRTVKKHE